MFNADVFELLKKLKKSPRGEYEVTDVLAHYANQSQLSYSILKSPWTDAGSFESLYNATVLMQKLNP
jgi:glucose-1-phosphate thymidylyltransferase